MADEEKTQRFTPEPPPVLPPPAYLPSPPYWPHQYQWNESPAPRGRGPLILSIVSAIVIVAMIGTGLTYLSRHGGALGVSSNPVAAPNAAVVDVNVDLGAQNSAAGTGMILTSDGEVLTNNHVVDGAFQITVQVNGKGKTYSAKVVSVDPSDDVALIQLQNASGLPTVSTGDSSELHVGQQVYALGNALGRGGPPVTVAGQITALNQQITASDPGGGNAETLNNMIEFNANIEPGDSGGPVFDSSNRVIGMTTAGSSTVRRHGVPTSDGFAIPINDAMNIVQLIKSGSDAPNIVRTPGPLLGVEAQDSSYPPGAQVVAVQPDTPAAKAGIKSGDVIDSVGGISVDSLDALHSALQHFKPGQTVIIGWIDTGGTPHQASVVLATGAFP